METSEGMEAVVTELTEIHGLDLTGPDARLELRLTGYMPLCIERRSPAEVAVYHYYVHGGQRRMDPEVVFFTGGDVWVPLTYRQDNLGHEVVYGRVTADGAGVEIYDARMQADLADFVRTWARNIRNQGWLEHGEQTEPRSLPQAPSVETLLRWEAEGGCEATDGCWIEPDGAPCHGVVNRSQSDH